MTMAHFAVFYTLHFVIKGTKGMVVLLYFVSLDIIPARYHSWGYYSWSSAWSDPSTSHHTAGYVHNEEKVWRIWYDGVTRIQH